jgi:hypothetical protein
MIAFSLETSRTRTLKRWDLIAVRSMEYSTKVALSMTACMTACIAEGAYTYEMNDK